MNATKEVEKLINKTYRPGEIFAASRFFHEHLADISEAAYYKAMERLRKQKKLERMARGIYCIPENLKESPSSTSELIIAAYIGRNKDRGMAIGSQLYYDLGLTEDVSNTLQIYSNAVTMQQQTIQDIKTYKLDIEYTDKVKAALSVMEVLENYDKIKGLKNKVFREFCKKTAQGYDQETFSYVLNHKHYKKSTIAFLKQILDYYKVVNTLGKILSRLSKYKIPAMDEINGIEKDKLKYVIDEKDFTFGVAKFLETFSHSDFKYDLIKDKPSSDLEKRTETAILAGIAHQLSIENGLEPPAWVFDRDCYLNKPYYQFDTKNEKYQTYLRENAPESFSSRNVFFDSNALRRV